MYTNQTDEECIITLAQLIPIISTTGSLKNSSKPSTFIFRTVNILTAIKVTCCTFQCASLCSFALDSICKYSKPVFTQHKKNEVCLSAPKL